MTTFLFVTGFGGDFPGALLVAFSEFSTQLHHLNVVAKVFIARGFRFGGHVTRRKAGVKPNNG